MRILLAVIGNDVHVVANRIIDQYLVSQSHTVANLGVACKPNEIIDGILEFAPKIVIISSLNGEASSWAKEFIYLLKKELIILPKLILGGINLFCKHKTNLIKPATPAAVSKCPILVFNAPK